MGDRTKEEIKKDLVKQRAELIELSRENIGMGNYMSIMHRYQVLLLHVIDGLLDVIEL